MKKDNSITNRIYKKSTIDKINKKIKLLGLTNKTKLNHFLSGRLIVCFILISVTVFLPFGIFYGPLFSVIFWYVYEYIVFDYQIKKREIRLNEQAPFFFEVLVMTLESGRNLENALITTSDNVKNELGREFKKSLNELKVGKNLNEVLDSLKEKIPSISINNIILNLIQANNFGTSMVQSLTSQLDYLREKKVLEYKANINKLPMKVSTISVLFLLPITILLLLTPVFLNSIENGKVNDQISSSVKSK